MVQHIVQNIHKAQEKSQRDAKAKNIPEQADEGWLLCQEEVKLITNDAYVHEIQNNLRFTIDEALAAYGRRLLIPVDSAVDEQSMPNKDQLKRVFDPQHELNTVALVKLARYIERLEFRSELVEEYVRAIKTLKNIRYKLSHGKYAELKEVFDAPDTSANLKILPNAALELKMAKEEFSNDEGMKILHHTLYKHAVVGHHKHAHAKTHANSVVSTLSVEQNAELAELAKIELTAMGEMDPAHSHL